MGDLISRQALCEYALNQKDKSITPNDIMRFPSAEPEYKELQEWKTDFKGFIDALDMPRDDYCGIMEYIDEVPSAESVKAHTKADYIMALHKEYGCTLARAEEAHNKALEYLRSKARMKG